MLSSKRRREIGRSSSSVQGGIVPARLMPKPCHLPCQRRASFRAQALSMAQGLPAAGLLRRCSVTNAGAWRHAQGPVVPGRRAGRWRVTWHTHRSRRQLLRAARMLAGDRAAAAMRCHSVRTSHAWRVLAHSIRTVACAQHGLPCLHMPAVDHNVLAARRSISRTHQRLFQPPPMSACTPTCRAPRAHRLTKDKQQQTRTRVRRERRV